MADSPRLTIPVLPGWEGDTSRPVQVDGYTVGWVLGRYRDWEATLWPVPDERPGHPDTCETVTARRLSDLRTELRRRLAEDGPWWVEPPP